MELIVPDEKLSLAIGKKGQNVRLASQLTGWRIDIHSESKIQELERRAKDQLGAIDGMNRDIAETLFRLGWRSVSELSRASAQELAQVPGINGVDDAQEIIDGSRRFIEGQRRRIEEARRDSERRARSGDGGKRSDKLMDIRGMTEEIADRLSECGFRSVELLARSSLDKLEETGIDVATLAKTRHWAKVLLGEISEDTPEPGSDSPADEDSDAQGTLGGTKTDATDAGSDNILDATDTPTGINDISNGMSNSESIEESIP